MSYVGRNADGTANYSTTDYSGNAKPVPNTSANNATASTNPTINALNAAREKAKAAGQDVMGGNLASLAAFTASQNATPVVTTTTPIRAQASQDSAKLDAMTANKQNQPQYKGAPAQPGNTATQAPAGSTSVTSYKDNSDGTTTEQLSDGSTDNVTYTKNADGSLTPKSVDDPNSVANLTKQQNALLQSQQANLDTQYQALRGANDVTYGNALTSAQNQYSQLKQQAQQSQDAYMATLNNASYSSQAFRYTPQITAGSIYNAEQAGLTKMQSLQTDLDTAIASAGAARDSGNLQAFGQYMNGVNSLSSQKVTLLQNQIKTAQDLQTKMDDSKREAAIAQVYSSGVTNPAQIIAKLNAMGITGATVKQIGDDIASLNPDSKGIGDIATAAAKNGATPATITAITGAKTLAGALQAAGSSLQDIPDEYKQYNYYAKQAAAAGQTPVSFEDYQYQENYDKAYAANAGSTDGKNSAQSSQSVNVPFATLLNHAASLDTVNGRDTSFTSLADLAKTGQWADLRTQLQNDAQRGLSATDKSQLQSRQNLLTTIPHLQELLSQYKADGGDTNILKGNIDSIGKTLGVLANDSKYKSIATELNLALQNYRHDMTGANFSAQEAQQYASVLPNAGNSFSLNSAILDGLNDYTKSNVDAFYTNTLGQGWTNLQPYANGDATITGTRVMQTEKGSQDKLIEQAAANPALEQQVNAAIQSGASYSEIYQAINGANSLDLGDSGVGNETAIPNPNGANRPQRNNNPSNIKASDVTSNYPGVTGIDPVPASDGGHFLTFATPEDGLAAQQQLITNPNYANLSVEDALRRWSNKDYGAEIVPTLASKKIKDLSPSELDKLNHAIAVREGFYA